AGIAGFMKLMGAGHIPVITWAGENQTRRWSTTRPSRGRGSATSAIPRGNSDWTLPAVMRSMAHYADWATLSGRHRGAGYLTNRSRAVIVILALVAGVGALVLWQSVGSSGCSGELTLRVAAAPEIAPAVRQSGEEWAKGLRAPGGQCV